MVFQQDVIKFIQHHIHSNELAIYILQLDTSIGHLPNILNIISFDEIAKARRYCSEKLFNRSVISYGILRYILGHYLNTPPKDIEFHYSQYGKPYIKNSSLQFNLSHSENLVLYAVANQQVGIDIEYVDVNLNYLELVEFVSSLEEMELFTSLPKEIRVKKFYYLWNIKEAIVKAIGYGLSYPIKEIQVLSNNSGRVILNKTQEFHFYPLNNLDSNYSGAVALDSKMSQIFYIKMNSYGIFDQIL